MSQFERINARLADALRAVLIEFGGTKVLCTASVEEKVPGHKKGIRELVVLQRFTPKLIAYYARVISARALFHHENRTCIE